MKQFSVFSFQSSVNCQLKTELEGSARMQSKITSLKSKIACVLCLMFCILLSVGCGEKENKNLVNARELILQGKYKESQGELNLALEADSKSPEALCPLKALEIIGAGTSTSARQKAVADIISLLTPIEVEIQKLEAEKARDSLKDDDADRLVELNRKWNLSLGPAARILKSQTDWISDVGRPAIDLLIEMLKASNPAVQSDIVELLVSLKEQTFEALIDALQDENGMVRRQAVIALGKIGDERAVEPVAALLDDDVPGVRFYVPVALDMIGGEKIIEPMHRALKNELANVRTAAANILGKIEDETGIYPLAELLADEDPYVNTSATNALVKIGGSAVPELIEVLDTRAENMALPLTDFVGEKIGDEYKKVLAKRAALQAAVAAILGSINDQRAVPSLLEAMRRKANAEATEEEKTNAASVRAGAAAALSAMGPAAVESLIKIVASPAEAEDTRVSAASILGTIGDKRAVVPLVNALKDDNKALRAAAAAALGWLPDEEAVLQEKLKDKRAVEPLIESLKDDKVVTRANAATTLGVLGDDKATQPLIDVVMNKTEREKIRSAAIGSLGILGDPAALGTLVRVLVDEREKDSIRKSAASALRAMENPGASEALIALLKGHVVDGIFMPSEGNGVISKWNVKEGYEARVEEWTAPAAASIGQGQVPVEIQSLKILRRGTVVRLINIYVSQGEAAEADTLVGLVAYKDRDIEQEERSSIRSAAASSLGTVGGENALAALMESVRKDKSAAVRKNSANSLREQGNGDARSVLIKAMNSDDSGSVRSAAAHALGVIKGESAVTPLMGALRQDKYDSTREKAAWALGEIADKQAVAVLVDALVQGRKGKAEASSVIAQVVKALDKLAAGAIDSLVAVIRNTEIDEVPRSRAAEILGLIEDKKATEPLIAALKDESVVVRSKAAASLGLVADRSAVEPLINALTDENEWVTVRANAATALQKIKDERAVEPLIDALDSDITAIRGNSVVALGPLKDKRATMPLIQKILENEAEDDTIRANAIASLGSIGDLRAVDALMAALNSDNITIRKNSATALGDLAADVAVAPLMEIVGDMNQPVFLRTNAAQSLGKIEDKRSIPLLQERLGDYDESDTVWNKVAGASGELRIVQVPEWVNQRAADEWEPDGVRNAAFRALSASASDLSELLKMLESDTVAIRAGAALVLGKTGSKEAVQPLIGKLQNDPETAVRRDAAIGLAAIADPTSEEALIKAHKEDAEGAVKIQSAIALGSIGGQKGIAALMETVQDTSKGRNVRANSAKALGDAGSVEAKSVLEAALKENVAVIHFEAAEALRKITGESQGYVR